MNARLDCVACQQRQALRILRLATEDHHLNIETDTFLATVLQHEIDRLDGILFIDYLSRLKRDLIKRKLRKISYQKNRKHERAERNIFIRKSYDGSRGQEKGLQNLQEMDEDNMFASR